MLAHHRCPDAESTALVRGVLARSGYRPKKAERGRSAHLSEMQAFCAMSILLGSGQARQHPWPLTLRKLVTQCGTQNSANLIAVAQGLHVGLVQAQARRTCCACCVRAMCVCVCCACRALAPRYTPPSPSHLPPLSPAPAALRRRHGHAVSPVERPRRGCQRGPAASRAGARPAPVVCVSFHYRSRCWYDPALVWATCCHLT